MLRSQTVNTIYDLHIQGKSVQEIAQQLGIMVGRNWTGG